ncbi:MAG TPA: M67 family metallopeptidase [Anaerolineae bacterium]
MIIDQSSSYQLTDMLKLTQQHIDEISKHGEATYPNEGGGFLIGQADGDGVKVVTEIRSFPNKFEAAEQYHRILITDTLYREGEAYAEGKGLDLIGFFHSHPDHPAAPSEFDREHALPWWSYVIVSVRQGQATDVLSWQLRDDRSAFDEENVMRTA